MNDFGADGDSPVYFRLDGLNPIGDHFRVSIHYGESRWGKGWNAELDIWVPYSDSIDAIKKKAREEARLFLQRALDAIEEPED